MKVVNSSACSLEAVIGISNRYLTRTLQPGSPWSMQAPACRSRPMPRTQRSARVGLQTTDVCRRWLRQSADRRTVLSMCVGLNDLAGELQCEPSQALADGAVRPARAAQRRHSNFKNFTMTVTGNAEMTLTQRAAPATAWVCTASQLPPACAGDAQPERGRPGGSGSRSASQGPGRTSPASYTVAKGRQGRPGRRRWAKEPTACGSWRDDTGCRSTSRARRLIN